MLFYPYQFQRIAFFTEISMCVTAKTTEKTISGMLAIIIPENTNTADGIADRIIAFASPFFFQKISHATQYAPTRVQSTTRYTVKASGK